MGKLKIKPAAKRKAEVFFSPKGVGAAGDMIIVDASSHGDELARILGIPEGWVPTQVGKAWACYNPGDRLTFAEVKEDLQGEDGEDFQ
jgi:hypothetical protein